MFHNPRVENSVFLYVKPSLGFLAALLGKRDSPREKATLAAHEILSCAGQVKGLGWYTERLEWRGLTSEP